MMLLDTSAVLPMVNEDDPLHRHVSSLFRRIVASAEPLLVHNYVIAETVSLVQRRHGFNAAKTFLDTVPRFTTHWVTPEQHEQACGLFLARGLRRLSLVDCVSFVVMRELGLSVAFTLDEHFVREGFARYGE